MKNRASFFVFVFLFVFSGSALAASSAIEILEEIPVQYSGRVKPFQSFAQEAAVVITGKRKFEGKAPAELIWSWMARPEEWFVKPVIPVAYKPLQEELGLRVIDGRISAEMALTHPDFIEKVQESLKKRRQKETLSPLEKKRLEVYDRAGLFRAIGEGKIPGWVGQADPRAGWFSFQQLDAEPEVVGAVRMLLSDFRVQEENPDRVQHARGFAEAVARAQTERGIALDRKAIERELTYNRLRPFAWAWKLYLLGALLFFVVPRSRPAALLAIAGGFLLHTYGFYLRCMISGRPPVSNMYESVVWVSWAVMLFALILFAIHRARIYLLSAAVVSTIALILAGNLPAVLDESISTLVPVLRSNLWLTVHVLTITLSYGAFALAWGVGHVAITRFALAREKVEENQRMIQYLYRALQIGVILLAAGTVLGGVWANYSWGRFWGWDPKETWALIALLGYLALLHGRYAGWIQPFGLAAGSVIAFWGVVMAWYGVNFVLASGLHSYGFGGGGAPYVLIASILDLVYVGAMSVMYKLQFKTNHGKFHSQRKTGP